MRPTIMAINTKAWAPVATFVAVLGVGAAAVVVSGGSDAPRPLRLADSGAAVDAAELGAQVAAGGVSGGYTLTGSLPEGRPDDAPAWTLPGGPAPAALVARLAAALGEATPSREGEGWRAGGLAVSGEPGRSWWWSRCGAGAVATGAPGAVAKGAPGTAVSSDAPVAVGVACAVDTPTLVDGATTSGSDGSGSAPAVGTPATPVAAQALAGPVVTVLPPTCSIAATKPDGTPLTDQELREASSHCPSDPGPIAPPVPPVPAPSPAPLPPSPSEAAVRQGVAPVLEALGLSDPDVQVYPGGGSATVRPRVGGREVVGLVTTVSVDGNASLVGASGWLADPERGDDYPLVTAREAFDALPPMARVLSCAVTPDGGCKDPGPVEVTGAHLGLTVAPLREGGQVLVPAWLFEVKGSPEPVPAIAVQEQYLPKDDPATEPALDPGSDPGTDPATGEPVPPPTQVDPAPPARSPLSFDSATRGKEPASVVVQYGDSGSCPHTGVTSAAKEDDTTVYVHLEADPMPADRACTDDYRPMTVTVELQAPLGDRKVVDATTGREVALS